MTEQEKLAAEKYDLYALYDRNGKLYVNGKQVLKGWESYSGWYWFATELNANGDKGVHFGLVQGSDVEWGYFDEAEFAPMIRAHRMWPIPKCNLAWSGRRT